MKGTSGEGDAQLLLSFNTQISLIYFQNPQLFILASRHALSYNSYSERSFLEDKITNFYHPSLLDGI